ncbi:MAG: HEAT repeat domain-containing protein, partial [Solirubrobacteraceae bacterium]|nr:HEAT repeat domain-containing protein [Solirubrobacteraceae bacterium]
ALAHDDPKVRAAAAATAIWDEWVDLEAALIEAASDEHADVAEAALYTLGWYPTRRVLRALAELEPHEDEDVRDQLADTLEALEGRFEWVLRHADPSVREALERWMEPVADLVDLTVEPDEPEDPDQGAETSPSSAALPIAAYEIQAMLADPDGEWAGRKAILRQADWAGHSGDERDALRAELPTHEDPWIRWIATTALGAWGDRDALVLLMLDDDADVRDGATVALGELDRDAALAPLLWARMLGTSGTPAGEALAAYVVHAPPIEARERLAQLVRHDPRQHIRLVGIWELVKLEAADEIASLAPLLDEPPGVSWSIHVALLDAMRKLEVPPPDLAGPLAVDHLDVVQAAAALGAARANH